MIFLQLAESIRIYYFLSSSTCGLKELQFISIEVIFFKNFNDLNNRYN